MKILHAGNMVNLGYVIAKQLRKDGIDAELLMEKNPKMGADPIKYDPTLNNNYPDWISFFDKTKSTWKMEVIKKMRDKKYDLIHAYVELPIFAYFSRRPFVAFTQGSDFREMAQSNSLRGLLLRKAYKRSKVILFAQPDHLPIFSKLKLDNGIFFPIIWDTSFFKPQQISDHEFIDKFVIFHPADLNWKLKGNDLLIRGFSEFIKENSNSILIIVDRGVDSTKTHDLVNSLGIGTKIRFLKGQLNRNELLKYYNISDVVADQFIVGSLGGVGLETLSCEKPLLSFIYVDLHKTLYGEIPPIAYASNSKEISEQLEKLKDKKFRSDLGTTGRKWVMKHHSPEIFSKKLQSIYDLVINEKKIDEIRANLSKINTP